MRLTQRKANNIVKKWNLEESSVRKDYSGRYMFGATTIGIVVGDIQTAEEIAKQYNLTIDNMGLGFIVY